MLNILLKDNNRGSFMKKLIAVLLASILVFGIIACGEKPGTTFVGKRAEYAGVSTTLEEMGIKDTYIELTDADKCVFSFNGKKIEGSYTIEGTVFTIFSEKADYTGTVEDSDLMLVYKDDSSAQDMLLYFEKQ